MNLLRTALACLLLAAPASAAKVPGFKIAKILNGSAAKLDGIEALKGKVVYIEFWATWCAPCVAGIPRMNKLVEAFKGEPVVFIAVTDEPAAVVEPFLKRTEMKAWVGLDEAKSSLGAFHVVGRPDGFLIGKDGSLLARLPPELLREKDLRDALAGRFKERPIEYDEPPAPRKEADASGAKTAMQLEITVGGAQKRTMRGTMRGDDDRAEAAGLPFLTTLAFAWGVEPDQVVLDTKPVDSFNFRFRAAPGKLEAGRGLMREAIEASFGVKVAEETRETDVYALVRSTAPGAPRPKPASPGVMTGLMEYGGGNLLGTTSMADAAQGFWMCFRKPVVDETGLAGDYEFDLRWKDGDDADRDRVLATMGLRVIPARRPIKFYRVVPAAR